MVWEWRCRSIVMLTELKEREQVQYGDLAEVQVGKWSRTFSALFFYSLLSYFPLLFVLNIFFL